MSAVRPGAAGSGAGTAAGATPGAALPEKRPAAVPGAIAALLGAEPSFTLLRHSAMNQATGGVWRLRGPGGSVVLKLCVPGRAGVVGSAETSADPRHWNHWRREPLAYLDGLATTAYADAGIDAPGLLAAEERLDGSFALWLEDVSGRPGPEWPVARLGAFGHALGAAQARWTGRVPDRPWLSRGWLRQSVTSKPIPDSLPWDHPTAVALWPAALRTGLRRMWDHRETLFAAAESTPRSLCHLDVWPLNLIAPEGVPRARAGQAGDRDATPGGSGPGGVPGPNGRGSRDGGRTVLLDWAFVGEGGVGEDIANLIPDCVADGLMPPGLLPEISEAVISGYLNGLRDGGLRTGPADEDALRHSVAAAGAAKYCWLAPLMLARLARGAPVGSPSYDVGGDDTAVMRRRIGLFEHLVGWSEEVLGAEG